MKTDRPRVLVGRFELDGHDRGVLSVINALRNAGAEVIYVHFSNPKEVVKAAIEEDAKIIGITTSLGQHFYVASVLLEEIERENLDITVIMGGVVPAADVPKLMDMGISKVFGPGSKPEEAVSFVLDKA